MMALPPPDEKVLGCRSPVVCSAGDGERRGLVERGVRHLHENPGQVTRPGRTPTTTTKSPSASMATEASMLYCPPVK